MGADRSANPAGEEGWQQTDGRCSGCGRWRYVHPEHRLPVGSAAEGPAAAQYGERLSAALGRRPNLGSHSSRILCAVSRTGWPRGQSDDGDHRQPKCEERGKRGRSIDACGYDAGKKIKGKKRHLLVDTEGLLLCAIVHAADVQDRDGGVLLMSTLFGLFPFL